MLPPPTADGKLPRWSPTSCLEWQCFGAEWHKIWLQKEKMQDQNQSNITWPGLLKLIMQIYIYFWSLHPWELLKWQKNGKLFYSSLSHCPSQPGIMCTNKSRMGRTLNIWQKAFRVSVVHHCSGGAEGEEGRAAPGESLPTWHRCSWERCCSEHKSHARETGYSCSTFPNHPCRSLYPVPKHNQETCAEDDLF